MDGTGNSFPMPIPASIVTLSKMEPIGDWLPSGSSCQGTEPQLFSDSHLLSGIHTPAGVSTRLYGVGPRCVTMRYVYAILSYRSRLAVVCRVRSRFALLSKISSNRILCD